MANNETPQNQAEETEKQSESIGFTVATRLALIGALLASPVLLYQDCNDEGQENPEDMTIFEPGEMPYPFPGGTGTIPAPTAKFKTTREACEHYSQLAPGGPMSKVKDDWAAQQVEWCLNLMEEKDFDNNSKYTALPNMLSFIFNKRFKKFVRHTKRDSEETRLSTLAPVMDPKSGKPARLWSWQYNANKKPVTDLWYKEYCYLIKDDAEKVTQANINMYAKTRKRIQFKWCFRPPEQQAIMWARTCHSGTTKKNCKKTNPKAGKVAGPGNSWHQLSGFDVANPKDSVKYLNDAGFIGYCDSNVKSLRDDDKGHFYPGNPLQIKNLKNVWENKRKLVKKTICEVKAWAGF